MIRKWLAATLVICGLAPGLLGTQVARADDEATGAQLLPKDTLLFFTVPSVPDFVQDFDRSVTGAMFRDPELQPFLDDVRAKIDELSEKLQEDVGVSIHELLAIPKGEFTFALVERPVGKLAPVLIVDYGDNKETIEKLLKKMHDELDGDVAEHSTQDVQDVTVHVYALKDQDERNPFKSVAYFNDDSCLVFSTEVDALKEVLDRWEGDSSDTLANDEVYKYVQERCKDEAGDPSVVWFLSPIGLIKSGLNMAASVNPQAGMAAIFLPTLGLDKLKGWGGAGYYGAGEFDAVSKTFVYAEQPTGVLNVFQFPAAELAPPKWVPADTSMYFSGNWNLKQAYQAVETMVDGVYGRGFTSKQLDKVADSDDGPGIHLKTDFLDLLDGKFHLVQSSTESEEDETEELLLLAFDVKDEAKAKQLLAKVAKSEGADIETRDFNGETIYEVNANNQMISMAVASGHLVFTNDTIALEGMLRSVARSSLVDSPAYRMIAKKFPAKLSMLSYSKSDTQIKAGYDLLKNADNAEVLDGIDMEKLPPFEVIQKYLRPSGSYAVPDPKGALFVGFQLREGDK